MSAVRPQGVTGRGTFVVARFSPVRPVLWLLVCVGLMAAMVAGVLTGDGDVMLGALAVLWVLGLGFVLVRWVVPRLTRMSRSEWMAFAADPYGIHLGAEAGKAPVRVPWRDVAGVVLREWRVGEGRRRRAVGIVGRTPDMPIGPLQVSPRELDARVSILLPVKDFDIDEQKLTRAVNAIAPGVPVVRHDRG